MQRFDDKGLNEARIYTVAFNRVMDSTATITSSTVEISVYDKSEVEDDDFNDLISDPPDENSAPLVIDGETVPISQAVSQLVNTGGVSDCWYVLSFAATCSNGEIFEEDVLLRIKKYVPTT